MNDLKWRARAGAFVHSLVQKVSTLALGALLLGAAADRAEAKTAMPRSCIGMVGL
jgi:hypothetical protein